MPCAQVLIRSFYILRDKGLYTDDRGLTVRAEREMHYCGEIYYCGKSLYGKQRE